MDAHHEHADPTAAPEIVLALAEFARIAQQILVANTPDAIEGGVTILLQRLLHLCRGQYGALLLSAHNRVVSPVWHVLPEKKMARVLAKEGMEEQELFALLTTHTGDESIQLLSSEPAWLMCRQQLALSSSLSQERQPLKESIPLLLSSPHCCFVLGGSKTGLAPSLQAMKEQVQVVWPLVAAGVSAVIVSLLHAEKMDEMEMATHQRDLQQMELLKAELLASVSHELRSPLASIQGYAATLLRHERRIGREERHEFLLAIHDASQRLEVIIDRLLEMSQLETETLPLKRAPVNLVYLAREAITAREQRLEGNTPDASREQKPEMVRQPAWTFTLRVQDRHGQPTDTVPLLEADRRLLREVLDHLLENAVVYSPKGGKIEVGLCTREPDEGVGLSQRVEPSFAVQRSPIVFPPSWSRHQPLVEIWVQDHGIGIPGPHLAQIFQRFYRVDTSLTREVSGLGLGLTICQQIVALHGGMLWVESEVGKGSTFHVLLPLTGRERLHEESG